eukprot:3885871-Amphidinium_carterae.2
MRSVVALKVSWKCKKYTFKAFAFADVFQNDLEDAQFTTLMFHNLPRELTRMDIQSALNQAGTPFKPKVLARAVTSSDCKHSST